MAMASGDACDPRIDGVDVVRCLALFSMYVAHTAPGEGPWRIFELSEYLTAALFALLVGVGAELGRRRHPDVLADFWAAGVRAVALVVIGRGLAMAGTQVVIVLVHLGVLTLVLAPLARMRSAAVAALALLAYAASPWLKTELTADVPSAPAGLSAKLLDLVATGEPYRLTTFVAFGLVGVLAARWLVRGTAVRSVARRGWTVGSCSLLAAGVVFGVEKAGLLTMEPYEGSHAEALVSTLLAVGVLGITVAAAGSIPSPVRRLLAMTGAMTLTLYAAHVVWLAIDVRTLPYTSPYDSWVNLVGLTLGSLVVAGTWGLVVRWRVLGRGPLEGLVAQFARPWFLRGRDERHPETAVR